MGGGRYGSSWNGRKIGKPVTHRGGRCHVRRPDPIASGGGWPENFIGEGASPSSSSLSGACARGGGGGWPESPPTAKTRLA